MAHDWELEEVSFLGKSKRGPENFESPKWRQKTKDAFKRALITAYRLEHGVTKMKDIAGVIDADVGNMSPGRLSQVLSDRDNLKQATILKLIHPIKSYENRRAVLWAYMSDMLSRVEWQYEDVQGFGESLTPDKVEALRRDMKLGNYHRVIVAALEAATVDAPSDLKYRTFLLGIVSASQLDIPGYGMVLVRTLIEYATEQNHLDALACAHYYRAQLLAQTCVYPTKTILAINEQAHQTRLRYEHEGGNIQTPLASYGLPDIRFQRIGIQVAHCERYPGECKREALTQLLKECQQLESERPKRPSPVSIQSRLARIEFLLDQPVRALDDLEEAYLNMDPNDRMRRDQFMLMRARSIRMTSTPEATQAYAMDAMNSMSIHQSRSIFRMLDLEILHSAEEQIKTVV